jgi:cytochrome c553
MKGLKIAAALVAALGLASGAAFAAGDAAAGKAKAGSCGGCHGANGEGKGPAGPAIAGMDQAKFVAAMKDYKSGKKANGPMKGATANLSDADIDNLAAHYASLKK